MIKKPIVLTVAFSATLTCGATTSLAGNLGKHEPQTVPDSVIAGERKELSKSANAVNSGPQSPRDIDNPVGTNKIIFSVAPNRSVMNLCNIHFHAPAEHRGGQFTRYIGNGDGKGYGTGYKFSGSLSAAELKPLTERIGVYEHGELRPGDTIEIHFFHSTAHVKPGPTLASCLGKETINPQLRAEAVVGVLVNDRNAIDFMKMTKVAVINSYYSAPNIPENLGNTVTYSGSTTGPYRNANYNTKPSRLQVTWNVRPNVVKIDIASLGRWLKSNIFNESHAHEIRNLVIDPALLSPIQTAK